VRHPKLRLFVENAGYPCRDETIATMTYVPRDERRGRTLQAAQSTMGTVSHDSIPRSGRIARVATALEAAAPIAP
jgi:hypothetical protein